MGVDLSLLKAKVDVESSVLARKVTRTEVSIHPELRFFP
jgi:hypothetical protein